MRCATVAASLLIDVVGYLERQGHPAPVVCRAAGLDQVVLDDPNGRLDGALMERIWEAGARLTGDPDLGLHTAEVYNPGALHIVGYVVLSCGTAAEALDRLARYAGLLNDGLHLQLVHGPKETRLVCDAVGGVDNYVARAPRQAMEAMAAGTVTTLKRLTPRHVTPASVTFRHPRPASVAEHQRILGTAVQFAATENAVAYRTPDLQSPILSANPALLAVFEAVAQRMAATLDRYGPLSRRVVALLGAQVRGVIPGLEELSRALALSSRSLQRQLRAEGTSYRALVDEVRRELALQHLARAGTTANEVAFLLGFSEPSAFTRAFKRWTGGPPSAFRSR